MMRVAIGAGGAAWEARTIADIEAHRHLVLARRCVDAADLVATAESDHCDVALVDPALPGLALDLLDRVRAAGVRIVSVGTDASEWGITEAVPVGRLADLAMDTPLPAASAAHRGRVVAVWGPTGAPGRTTLAISLAAAAQAAGERVVLVDADIFGGSVAQHLAILDDVSALMAACRDANHGSLHDIARHLVKLDDGMHVLTGIPRSDMWIHVRARPFAHVLEALIATHDLVVIDTSFGIESGASIAATHDQVALHVLEHADATVVVGRADPIGIARLVRALDEASGLLREHLLVLNGMRRSIGWSEDELTQAVGQLTGRKVDAVLPWDQLAIDQALMAGVPVRETTPGSAYAMRVELLLRQVRQVVGSGAVCNV